jgi:hypothetical protein
MSTEKVIKVTRRGTTRNDLDTAKARARMEKADRDELVRLLDESLHVVDGLREVVRRNAEAGKAVAASLNNHWMGVTK